MGQVIAAWQAVTAVTLSNMFNGTFDDNLTTLTNLVANGQFFAGNGADPPLTAPQNASDSLQSSVLKAFYAYTIPALWSVSGAAVFVIDAGFGCNVTTPQGFLQDMSGPDQSAMFTCINGNSYFLASANANVNKQLYNWGAPVGSETMQNNSWGGVKVTDLVAG
jgi:hypothetical protein